MPEKLTDKQARVFDFIKHIIYKKGYAPTIREIGAAFNLKSTSTVQSYIDILERKGYIRRSAQKKKTYELVDGNSDRMIRLPIVEYIDDEHRAEVGRYAMPADYVPEGAYVMHVGVGAPELDIRAGDILIIDPDAKCNPGETIAVRDNGAIAARQFADETKQREVGKVIGLCRWY
jgi:repressor LexA